MVKSGINDFFFFHIIEYMVYNLKILWKGNFFRTVKMVFVHVWDTPCKLTPWPSRHWEM